MTNTRRTTAAIDRDRDQLSDVPASPASDAIRPFRVDFPDAALSELRRRINATQWPDRETVMDQSQGPPLATMQKLAHY
jgi:hypothetical protein